MSLIRPTRLFLLLFCSISTSPRPHATLTTRNLPSSPSPYSFRGNVSFFVIISSSFRGIRANVSTSFSFFSLAATLTVLYSA